jgi:hypothetical protein
MFVHNKKLQCTVRVSGPNPALASLMLEQTGGGHALFTQALSDDVPVRKDLLPDIATQESIHRSTRARRESPVIIRCFPLPTPPSLSPPIRPKLIP